ncbi:DUF3307 domain-containing protein [Virgibacillus sp. NKC19-16]|nr:DUF3307 domain-containing protein [Virgibacillus sp. NKC19-16]
MLEPDWMNTGKNLKATRIRALLLHVGIHLTTYVILVVPWLLWQKEISVHTIIAFSSMIFIIGVTHFGIDFLKLLLKSRLISQKRKALIYSFDQVLHIMTIAIVLTVFDILPDSLIFWAEGLYLLLFEGLSLSDFEKLLAMVILVLINTFGISYLLSILLKNLTPPSSTTDMKVEEKEVEENNSTSSMKTTTRITIEYQQEHKNLGRYIGILERILIMIFVVNESLTGIALLVAIKSITRFKQFDDKRFAEYYLVGTLLSIVSAVCIGYIGLRII